MYKAVKNLFKSAYQMLIKTRFSHPPQYRLTKELGVKALWYFDCEIKCQCYEDWMNACMETYITSIPTFQVNVILY
jgi:hypothetical protein